MKTQISVEVFFDFICPWCLIGKRQLKVAIEKLNQTHPDIQVNIKWRGIQLLPDIPIDGLPFKAFYLQRLGSSIAVKIRQEQVRQAAKVVGVDIDFERIPLMPNTAKTHILFSNAMKLVDSTQHDLLLEGIFLANFHHSENISDPKVLQHIALSCGYTEEQVRELLKISDRAFVSANTGGKGVPYFVIEGSVALAGAQPANTLYETILDALELKRRVTI